MFSFISVCKSILNMNYVFRHLNCTVSRSNTLLRIVSCVHISLQYIYIYISHKIIQPTDNPLLCSYSVTISNLCK